MCDVSHQAFHVLKLIVMQWDSGWKAWWCFTACWIPDWLQPCKIDTLKYIKIHAAYIPVFVTHCHKKTKTNFSTICCNVSGSHIFTKCSSDKVLNHYRYIIYKGVLKETMLFKFKDTQKYGQHIIRISINCCNFSEW